jgi:hypothetical protein
MQVLLLLQLLKVLFLMVVLHSLPEVRELSRWDVTHWTPTRCILEGQNGHGHGAALASLLGVTQGVSQVLKLPEAVVLTVDPHLFLQCCELVTPWTLVWCHLEGGGGTVIVPVLASELPIGSIGGM